MTNTAKLLATVKKILQSGKGILAADESTGTIKKRLDSIGMESNEENRRTYRNTLFTTPGFADHISGVILFDETVDQKDDSGQTFAELIASTGAVPGIKVDKGKDEHPDHAPQTLTKGLDGLGDWLDELTKRSNGTLGFTKWRQVILVEPASAKATAGRPEPAGSFLEEAMDVMAKYAKTAQEHGYVPIVEPEVLMDGKHTIEQCAEVTERTLKIMYAKLAEHGVVLEGTLLKPNMVLSGKENKTDSPEEVAEATLAVFQKAVPKEVPGIVFLSGGQTPVQATENLNAINVKAKEMNALWVLSFSYGRALQEDALKTWAGKAENMQLAQAAFAHRAAMNGAAQKGKWSKAMEEKEVAGVA